MMQLNYSVILATLFISTLLSGCQQHASVDTASVQKQNEQLASLVAAADYLRVQCNDSTVPVSEVLLSHAIEEGTSRGWKINTQRIENIRKEAAFRYQALAGDKTQLEASCSTLRKAAAPFVYPLK